MVHLVFALLPLAAGLALVRMLPEAILALDQPVVGMWRFDPLALIGCCILPLAAVRPQQEQGLRTTLAVGGCMLALLLANPTLQVLALVLASLLVVDGLGPRWFIALACFASVTFAPTVLSIPASLPLYATIGMAFIGSGAVPWPGRHGIAQAETVLRPFWLLVLLRTLVLEPWPIPTVVVATALGTVALAAITYAMVRSAPPTGRERMLAGVLVMAFIAASQNTTLGVVATLWALVMYAVLAVTGRVTEFASLSVVCITLGVAGWWTAGAVAAAGGFLGAIVICWTTAGACIATFLGARSTRSTRMSNAGRFLVLMLSISLVLGSPWATTTLALPVAQGLGAGLTAPGLLDVWPFIGVSALDAGHRRITLMPGIMLGCLLLLVWAVTWLVSRIGSRARAVQLGPSDDTALKVIRTRVWWLR